MMLQDNAFLQGRENNNQQTTGARVMTAVGDDDEEGEGWMTLLETPLWLPLL